MGTGGAGRNTVARWPAACCAGTQYHELKWAPGANLGQPGMTLLAASDKPYCAAFTVV